MSAPRIIYQGQEVDEIPEQFRGKTYDCSTLDFDGCNECGGVEFVERLQGSSIDDFCKCCGALYGEDFWGIDEEVME